MNGVLKQEGEQEVSDLSTDLSDGLRLLRLVEILSGQKCPERVNRTPKLEIQKVPRALTHHPLPFAHVAPHRALLAVWALTQRR